MFSFCCSGQYVWQESHEVAKYTNWNDGEPNDSNWLTGTEDCVVKHGGWEDFECNRNDVLALCETDSPWSYSVINHQMLLYCQCCHHLFLFPAMLLVFSSLQVFVWSASFSLDKRSSVTDKTSFTSDPKMTCIDAKVTYKSDLMMTESDPTYLPSLQH